MVFSSIEFLLCFLPVFFILYALTPDRYKNITLLAGSLIFYALGEPHYLALLLISITVNHIVGRVLGGKGRHRILLSIAIIGNVGVLFAFKAGITGMELPLGISFYTFQILSYLIDVYRGDIEAEHSFVKTAAYVTMFPQLVAGPIVNYGEVSAALSRRKMTWRSVQDGLKIFTLGLIAKVLLADRVGLLWNEVQVRGFESISTPLAWLAAYAYSLKIYFDFYGYSLMALGLGTMLGFTLPQNFQTPYMAKSVREFYRRWHITLGRWFRNYVYIPLGGSRNGMLCTVRNLLIVWALTALWHGSTGNFLLWGIVLWAIIVAERLIKSVLDRHPIDGKNIWQQMVLLPHLYLCLVIPVTWMLFAITDVNQLWVYLGRMFGTVQQYAVLQNDWRIALGSYGVLLALGFIGCTPLVGKAYQKWKDSMPVTVILAVLFWVCVWRIMVEGNNPFMYFKF